MPARPKRIAVSGAASHLGSGLLPGIVAGGIFGSRTPVLLQCLESPSALAALDGLRMELEDCASPLLEGVVCSDDPMVVFRDADLVLLCGASRRSRGAARAHDIREAAARLVPQARAIDVVAARHVRILVLGDGCNTACLVAMHHAPRVPRASWSALARHDHNRATAGLALRAGVHYREVRNVVIWGNLSDTLVPDWTHARIRGQPAQEIIDDAAWFTDAFVPDLRARHRAIHEARGQPPTLSAAAAAIEHCRLLADGTPAGDWTSMAVCSDGAYGIEAGLVSSCPVICEGNGSWALVRGLELDAFTGGELARSAAELVQERDIVRDLLP